MKKTLRKLLSILIAALTVLTCFAPASPVIAADSPDVCISFDKSSSMSLLTGAHNMLVTYSSDEKAALLAVAGDDPFVLLDVESKTTISADVYKYVVVTYRVPVSNSNVAQTTELFMSAGQIAGPTAGYSVLFNPTRSYKYRSEVVDMTGKSYWTGNVHSVRFDSFTSGSVWDLFYIASVTFCADRAAADAAAAAKASEANGVIDGIDESVFAARSYDLGIYTQKYWKGQVVYNEAVYPLCNADGTISPSGLMYKAKKIISVRDASLQRDYKYGADYIVTPDGKLQIVSTGSIPLVPYTSYYSSSAPSAAWMPCLDGRYTAFSENGDIHRMQLAVTYVHEDSWDGFTPISKTDLLPKTFEKLSSKSHISVVFFGDSVSVGCNASGLSSINTAPYMPLWSEMTIAGLKAKYGYNDISFVNTAVGGTTSDWGREQVSARVAAYNPDLVFLGFGTNDGTAGLGTATYKANFKSIIDTVRAQNPNCEFVLVSPVLPNQETAFAGVQESYIPILRELEQEYSGIALIDLMTPYKEILAKKKFSDLTGNNINHPNDFFIRYYAQSILTALSESDIVSARNDAVRILGSYVSLNDYLEAEQAEITSIIASATEEINSASTESEVLAVLNAAKAQIDQVKTAAQYEAENLDYTALKFGRAATLTTLKKLNNVSVTQNSDAAIFASAGNDPYFRISYNDGDVSADTYKYLVLVYNIPSTVANTSQAQLFFTAGSYTTDAESRSMALTLDKGSYSYEIVDLSAVSYWSGKIHGVRIDPFATYTAGDTFSLHSVCLFETAAEASAYGGKTVNILNGTYTGSFKSIQFDTQSEISRITASGEHFIPGDLNNSESLNSRDLATLKMILAGTLVDPELKDRADVNRDGRVNSRDMAMLKRIFVGEEPLPDMVSYGATVSYSEEEKCALIESYSSSAQITADVSDKILSKEEINFVTVVYKNTAPSAQNVTLALQNGTECEFTAPHDSLYSYEILDFSDKAKPAAPISSVTLTFDGSALCLGALIFSESESAAAAKGALKARSLDRMTGDVTPAVGQTVVPLNETTTMATFSGYTATSGDAYAFNSALTFTLDRQPDREFDRISFRYTASTVVRGVIKYSVNGSTETDEFFLEAAGTETVFRTLIPGYFKSETATEVISVTLYPQMASATTFSLKGIETEDADNYNGEIYLQNSHVKVGILLTMGGGISHYEKVDDNNPSYANLLNRYDVGRLIQQSYYGIDRAPYVLGTMGGDPWGYNPVQGGDRCNNPSQIVDLEVSDTDIYVKVRPMDWGHDGHITPSYMENWYYLCDSFVKVDNRFVDFSGYTHTVGWQELPAFYTVSALNNFYYYNGSSPWTGDSLIKRSDLVFWGAVSNQAFDLRSTSEFWSAWCDNSGFGVGLYVPGVYTYHAGKFGYDGSPSPDAPSTNYVAPRRNMTIICGKPLVYSYLIAAGNLNEIRNTFRDNRGLINNYALEHYNG